MSTKLKAGTSTSGAVLDADTTGILEFQTGSTPTTAITINASQSVGVGTASPAAKFEVTGGGNSGREPFAVNGTNATDLYTTYRYNTSTLLGYIGNGAGTITSASASDFGIRSQNALAFATGGATEQMRLTSAGLLQFNSGYGSVATAYGCRAWVNFNGTGTPAIRSSGNVSSIGDNGVGDYTINFTSAMPDINYSVSGGGSRDGSTEPAYMGVTSATTPTTSLVRVRYGQGAFSPVDVLYASVMIVR